MDIITDWFTLYARSGFTLNVITPGDCGIVKLPTVGV
jgi:hypothetical protein